MLINPLGEALAGYNALRQEYGLQPIVEVLPGVFTGAGFNFYLDLKHAATRYTVADDLDSVVGDSVVADTVEQVLAHWQDRIQDPQSFYAISGTKVLRDPSLPGQGWRWHKWGAYIGERQPKWEYLNDEPDIPFVLVCNIYRLAL